MLRLIAADKVVGLLHPKEKTVLSGYTLAKRRNEYLIGRICAKSAVQAFLLDSGTCPKALALAEIAIAQYHPWPTRQFHCRAQKPSNSGSICPFPIAAITVPP